MQIINGDLSSNLNVSGAYSDNVFYSQSYCENIIWASLPQNLSLGFPTKPD